MWVRQVTKILFVMFPCLGASVRHGGARRFYYLLSLKPPRGRPFEGRRRSIVFGGMGTSAPILIIYPIHAFPIRFSKEPYFFLMKKSLRMFHHLRKCVPATIQSVLLLLSILKAGVNGIWRRRDASPSRRARITMLSRSTSDVRRFPPCDRLMNPIE